jgi:hypothetical protein
MDFRQSSQPGVSRPNAAPAAATEHKDFKQTEKTPNSRSFFHITSAVLLISAAVLIAGVAIIVSRTQVTSEAQYVDASKYQAVFLNNGQVYFGKVKTLNKQFVRMTSVYYLTQSGQSGSSNYSLVKLGCQQIHDPYDQMVVNRDQVTFWENLNADGKVVKSIEEFKKQNPNGPDCTQVSNQTQATGTNAQGSATNGTGTGNSTTDTTTKK